MSRLDSYLQKILSNPNRWVYISKIKKFNRTEDRKERRNLIEQIQVALKLMDISFEIKGKTTYTIRMIDSSQDQRIIAMDFGHSKDQTVICKARSGGKTGMLIIDDMWADK